MGSHQNNLGPIAAMSKEDRVCIGQFVVARARCQWHLGLPWEADGVIHGLRYILLPSFPELVLAIGVAEPFLSYNTK